MHGWFNPPISEAQNTTNNFSQANDTRLSQNRTWPTITFGQRWGG